MGEFGFVTGDGVYHLTVYATDENGNFKILKMKNFYIGLPGEGTTVAPTRPPAPPPRAPPTTGPTPSTTRSPILQHLDGLMGCGSCVVPGKKGGELPAAVSGEGLIDERFGEEGPLSPTKPGVGGGRAPGGGAARPLGGGNIPPPSTGGLPSTGPTGTSRPRPGGVGGTSQYSPPSGAPFGQNTPSSGQAIGTQRPADQGQGPSSGGAPYTPEGQTPIKPGSNPNSGKGSLPKPGQSFNGLPPGLSMSEMMELLYKFNYTLKYHGHHESGYRNGDKEGGYFFNGRDGLGRDVKYIANEFGFQPNISLVDLGLQASNTPKGGEDELSNELKGYEFKWFYSK